MAHKKIKRKLKRLGSSFKLVGKVFKTIGKRAFTMKDTRRQGGLKS